MSHRQALFLSYGKDWLLILIILIAFTFVESLEPFHRQFSVTDPTIQHPFAKNETIPVWLALVIAFVVPGSIIAGIAYFYKKSFIDMHNGLLGLVLTQALVLIITDSIKTAVGRPRPDFLDRCLNIYDSAYQGTPLALLSDPVNMLSDSSICTRTELLKDGFKSFPSGHAAFSFGGLGYLSMYFAGKLHLFDEHGHIYKSIVVLAPLILAALIAISRVDNYRHHWQDVTVGTILGIISAIFSYRQYYPSLATSECHSPFSPRKFGELTAALIPHHNRDDHDEETQLDESAHRQSFLNNVRGPGSLQRGDTQDSGTSLNEIISTNGSMYDPARTFDQSLRGQGGQRSDDNRLGFMP